MKKVLSLVLVVVMLCSSFAGLQITSHAANLPSSGSCGDGVTFTFDSATGLLTISGSGAMRADAFEKYSVHFIAEIKTVVINNGVTSIGYSAFKGCSGLTSVTIGSSVTSINDHAFSGCSSLTSIIIPNSVTSIGGLAFRGCSGLTSVSIGNSVTIIGSFAFEDCSGLTNITIPDSVTSIEWSAFCDCSGLTGITIPNSVTSIGDDAFSGCSGLTSVSIGNSVTSIGDFAFYGCSGLTGITVDSGNTQYDSRGNCNAIIETSTNTLVTGCKNTVIPNTVTSIGNNAFHGCSGLTSITIPDSVTSIGSYAFSGCSGLTGITIPNSVTSIGSSAFRGCSGLTGITIPDSVTSIGDYAFRDCSGLTSVTIGNSVTSIGDSAFDGCHGLTSVNISSIGAWCSISFISYDSNPLYYAHNLYLNNELITDLAIPNSVTSIGNNAFFGCSGLTSITIPNSVTSIGRSAFSGCNSLKDVYYSGSESEWNEIDIGEYNGYLLAAILHLNTKPVHTHEYVGAITTPATCTEAGVKTFTCTCGETYTEQVAALGHDYGSWALTKAPTCTAKGEETRVCNRDISHKEVRDIAALGHKFAAGEQYCQNGCGSINPDYVPPHTHSYTSAITTQATCTQAGVMTYTCICGEKYTDAIPATGHKSIVLSAVEPTCTKTGLTEGEKCSVCGEIIKAQSIIDALGHAFGAWQQTKAPTCTAKGEETRVCNRDISHKEVRDIAALGHNSDVEKTVTSGATQLGYTEHRCSRCDELQNVDSFTAPTGKLTQAQRENGECD